MEKIKGKTYIPKEYIGLLIFNLDNGDNTLDVEELKGNLNIG